MARVSGWIHALSHDSPQSGNSRSDRARSQLWLQHRGGGWPESVGDTSGAPGWSLPLSNFGPNSQVQVERSQPRTPTIPAAGNVDLDQSEAGHRAQKVPV